jgi:regulator of sirC expression with transglutaminase-like and TPR domain
MMDSGVKKALDRLFAERQRHYWSLDYETTTNKLLELAGELEKALEKSSESKKQTA